jgi:hypothetical protein
MIEFSSYLNNISEGGMCEIFHFGLGCICTDQKRSDFEGQILFNINLENQHLVVDVQAAIICVLVSAEVVVPVLGDEVVVV